MHGTWHVRLNFYYISIQQITLQNLKTLGGGGGKGEMNQEGNMKTYVTICKTDSQWEFVV